MDNEQKLLAAEIGLNLAKGIVLRDGTPLVTIGAHELPDGTIEYLLTAAPGMEDNGILHVLERVSVLLKSGGDIGPPLPFDFSVNPEQN
jgi:hypothetical protein